MLYSRNDEIEIIWKSFGHSYILLYTITARVPVTLLCRFIEHRVSRRSLIYLYIILWSHLDSVTWPKAVCPLHSVFGEGGGIYVVVSYVDSGDFYFDLLRCDMRPICGCTVRRTDKSHSPMLRARRIRSLTLSADVTVNMSFLSIHINYWYNCPSRNTWEICFNLRGLIYLNI